MLGALLLVLIAIVYVNCVIYWKAEWISMLMAVIVWYVYEKLPTAFIDGKLLRFVKIDEMAVILAFNDRIGCIGDLSFALFHRYLASNNHWSCL